MTEIISVKFKENGRAYSFDPAGITAEIGESVIVETQNGTEMGCRIHQVLFQPR